MAGRTDDAAAASWDLRVVLKSVAGSVDRLFRAAVLSRPRARSAEELGPVDRVLALQRLNAELDVKLDPQNLFPVSAPIDPEERFVRREKGDTEVVDLRFDSGHQLVLKEVADRWARHPQNRTVPVRWFRGPTPRPTILLLHGYLGGAFALGERVWPIRWLVSRGMDVVLFTLPFHGERRRPGGRSAPPFPAADPRFTIEGFRQSVIDIRSLSAWLRGRGASAVGAMGMSLGGYTTALASTIVDLDFAVPFIPLASIADFAREGGRLIGTASQQQRQHELLETTYSCVSPFRRSTRVPKPGRLVVAGRRDRITPIRHAERIAEHFDAPLVVFSGGHLFQLGRSKGFRAVGRMLGQLGLLVDRT